MIDRSVDVIILKVENGILRKALAQIADIAEGSQTLNSLPHIARIARTVIEEANNA